MAPSSANSPLNSNSVDANSGGGLPLDQRPQVPLTAEQYRHWEENEQSASLWAGITALCFVAALGTAVWLRVARRIRRLT
jgi:hypothetical protein